jgi:16S rRNA (guanine(527)-N(7))-methyltransferase RsmG
MVSRLEAHWELVKAWNARVNLTSIADDAEAAERHYADSLVALQVLPLGPIVDIGSGAGYPGVPIAIVQPERPVILLEPRRKRASFLEMASARLGLRNVRVIHGRVEDAPDQSYAAAVTRATFSDPKGLQDCLGWVQPEGQVVLWRSDPTGLHAQWGGRLHPYELAGQKRLLEIWVRS